MKSSVQEKFTEVRKAIDVREKLLLRQIDVIASHYQHQQNTQLSATPSIEDIYFVSENEKNLLDCIRTFGKFNLENINFTNDLFINEDYILPSNDHEISYKCLDYKKSNENDDDNDDDDNEKEKIIVNFSNNKKLIQENVDNINESIIHITLNEAKKLIEKTKLNNLYQTTITENILNENQNDNDIKNDGILISQSSQTDIKQHINPNVTINNCNGTINLKNISNLTINCVTQDSFNIPDNDNNISSSGSKRQSIESDNSNSQTRNSKTNDNGCKNKQKSSASTSQLPSSPSSSSSSKTTITKDSENNSVNCEFYDRLISEIKNTIKQSQKAPIECIPLGRKAFNAKFAKVSENSNQLTTTIANDAAAVNNSGEGSSSDSIVTTTDSYNRRLLLKNFENLKIILENNENEPHPVQIEQWLTEIISETEIEPMQNTDILEHSIIHSNG